MIVSRLQDILEKRYMSRRELARRSGLNINTVCKLANDDSAMIDLRTLDQVYTTLHVTPGELLVWERDPKQTAEGLPARNRVMSERLSAW